MIEITDKSNCSGCTACASICAHDAIEMKPDNMGFLYPKVDVTKCIDCGLCDKVCQFNDNYDKSLNLEEPIAFAARHKDIKQVMWSRSGAAFAAMSDYILEQGGVVYGAGYKDHFRVVHKRATTKEERDEFRGSKYVQSDMTGVFRQVKEDLKNGLTVMFSGTPCQTSGLNAFVGKRLRENLYLVDIVCNGVPGPNIWQDFLTYIEKKQGSRIVKVNFRDKELYGWKAHKESFVFANGGGKISFPELYYFYLYFRQSCSVCHFCNLHRPSDITIADYWGWERTDETINKDDKGCSLVLCNTEKGYGIFEKVNVFMDVIPADLSNIMQTHLYKPSERHPLRDNFEQAYIQYGLEKTMRIFGVWPQTKVQLLKSVVRKIIIKITQCIRK